MQIDVNKKPKPRNYFIIRGTTPIIKYKFPVLTATITDLSIVFSQNGVIILEKHLDDLILSEKSATLTLKERETLLFDSDYNIQMQARAKIGDDILTASRVFEIGVAKTVKDGVL